MTIFQWQIVAVIATIVLCVLALSKNKVVAGKLLVALGLTVVLALQLLITPLDRKIQRLEQQLIALDKNPQKKEIAEKHLADAKQKKQDLLSGKAKWTDYLPFNLGLDLKGGTEVRLRLKPDRTRLEMVEKEVEGLEAKLKTLGGAEAEAVKKLLEEKKDEQSEELASLDQNYESAVEIIRERLNGQGLTEIPVTREGESRVLIQLPGMDKADTDRVIDVIQQQGILEFRLVVEENDDPEGRFRGNKKFYDKIRALGLEKDTFNISASEYRPLSSDKGEILIAGGEKSDKHGSQLYDWLLTPPEVNEKGVVEPGTPYLVEQKIKIDGSRIIRANAEPDPASAGYRVSIAFDTIGSEKFFRITKANVGRKLGIVLDGSLRSAPVLREPISGGRAVISGNFDAQESRQLAVVLKSGSLKVKIERESESFVGPTLGGDSIRSGIKAMVIGLAAVVGFMLAYYLIAGVVTNIALFLNMLFIISVLSAADATLTLPGIAGLILTIGMAVDANVLIFERIREERDKGNSLTRSIELGYERAFVTIVDANVTTLITAIILHSFGTEAVKGFAMTLVIGILSSMFCALVITRWIFQALTDKGLITDLKMNRLLTKPSINFIGMRRPAMALSLIMICAGMAIFFSRGERNYAHDFNGGCLVQVKFSAPMETESVRARVAEKLTPEGYSDIAQALQSVGEVTADGKYTEFVLRTQHVKPGSDEEDDPQDGGFIRKSGDDFKQSLQTAFPELDKESPFTRFETVGGYVAGEMKTKALLALLYSMVAIFFYIWLRFQFRASFGIGAVVALIHDVLLTVGALAVVDHFGLLNGQIDLKIVAALLTIVGYSLNDTIVVFDRVRENIASGRNLEDVINLSINQTISRTIITSLTTLVVVIALLAFGGDVIRGFAFALFIGVFVGTYSSIFIASPVLVELAAVRAWKRKHDKQAKAATV